MSKRKNLPGAAGSASKRPKLDIPEYHLAPTVKENDGSIQWPAPAKQMERARELIRECASKRARTLIVPDKDADGLSAGAILRHTLILLGLPGSLIDVHVLSKGTTIHSEEERNKMATYSPALIFIIDQGSRPGPPVIDTDHQALIIDHHHATSDDFPKGSEHVTACDSPPVATSSLLTYLICEPLHADIRERCDWLAVVGTHGDLGNTLKWESPFPDMRETFKKYTKKALNDVVSLINAPRRTGERDILSAWSALCDTRDPTSILKNPRLAAARAAVNVEVERCTHAAPKFSPDGKVAVFRIRSEAQVHPVIATRWAGHLSSKALEMVMVANEGYLPGKVNFSCRIPRCARGREPPVSIIERLKFYASLTKPLYEQVEGDKATLAEGGDAETSLLLRIGDDFARGHVQASGGIVDVDQFDELMALMQIGVKMAKKDGVANGTPKKKVDAGQKNTLAGYFTKTAPSR